MHKFGSRQSQSTLDTSEGWVVQVYGRDRRLLCVLDPSHGWSFLMGCGFGLLLAVLWLNIARHSSPPDPTPPTEPSTELPTLHVD